MAVSNSDFSNLVTQLRNKIKLLHANDVLLFTPKQRIGLTHTYLNSFCTDEDSKQFVDAKYHDLYKQMRRELITSDNNEEVRKIYVNNENPLHKTRSHHDCNCCLTFIKRIGAIVFYDKNKDRWSTVWEGIRAKGVYKNTATDMHKAVIDCIPNGLEVFQSDNKVEGLRQNTKYIAETGKAKTYYHFFAEVPKVYRNNRICMRVNDAFQSLTSVFKMELAHMQEVLVLCQNNLVTRGSSYVSTLKTAIAVREGIESESNLMQLISLSYATRTLDHLIFNSVIFTIVKDLDKGIDEATAVDRYERKVDPSQFNQSTTAPTAYQAGELVKVVNELGIRDSLKRKHAVMSDVSVNDVLWVNQELQGEMKDPLMDLINTRPKKLHKKMFDDLQEISVDEFMDMLPKVEELEILNKPSLQNHIATLIGPAYENCPPITAWGNNFNLTYQGNNTDSISNRVTNNKGSLVGNLRCSIAWDSADDYDIRCEGPVSSIYFGNKGRNLIDNSYILDIDANAGSSSLMEKPVENLIFKDNLVDGLYVYTINNYKERSHTPSNPALSVELAFGGKVIAFGLDRKLRHEECMELCRVRVAKGVVVESAISGKMNVLGDSAIGALDVEEFVPIDTVMLSPNFWESGNKSGSKHVVLVSSEVAFKGRPRGVFSEFLPRELHPHRKVLTQVALNSLCPESKEQVTGFGFSSNKREQDRVEVTVRVHTKDSRRLYKVKF